MTSGIAEINGAALYYEVAGEGHSLVLVHAGIADSRMWDSQFVEFAKYYRVIRYDRRGSGKSRMPDGEFYDADDLFALLKLLNVDTTYCLGLSRGASIVLEFALDYPAMIDALIFAAPGGLGTP